ncbi:MAG: hypothetical protein ACHREM_33890, partial [Polyangiales bacterium]
TADTTTADTTTADTSGADTGHDAGTTDTGHDSGAADTGTADTGHDSGATDTGTVFAIAPHPAMPQVLDQGGNVLKSPVFQSISFKGYDQTSDVDTMVDTVGTLPYWAGAVGEYGVGTPTVQPPVHLTETALSSYADSDVQALLQPWIDAGTIATPTSEMIYVISFPKQTTLTDTSGNTSCIAGGFGGYHGTAQVTKAGSSKRINVQYAVIPECEPDPDAGFVDPAIKSTTEAISHELVEAVTDPLVGIGRLTWYGTDPAFQPWATVLGIGELGDACSLYQSSYYQPAGYAYFLQRTWSNKNAAASHDPCAPELDGEICVNAATVLPDTGVTMLDPNGNTVGTTGVLIAQGSSKTIEVDLFSDAPMANWTVSAEDLPMQTPAPATPNLSFAWDKTTGNNGDKLHLTITFNTIDPTVDGALFFVHSTLDTTHVHHWIGYVGYH